MSKNIFKRSVVCLGVGYQQFETLLSNTANCIIGGKTVSKFPAYACLVCSKGPPTATVPKGQKGGEQPFRHEEQIKLHTSEGHITNNTDMFY